MTELAYRTRCAAPSTCRRVLAGLARDTCVCSIGVLSGSAAVARAGAVARVATTWTHVASSLACLPLVLPSSAKFAASLIRLAVLSIYLANGAILAVRSGPTVLTSLTLGAGEGTCVRGDGSGGARYASILASRRLVGAH